MSEILAIIPARGGSKSIPKKNIALLNGQPLMAYIIETCLKSTLVSRIIVSTDDEEIAQVGRRYGADVPFMRPAELARDDSPTLPVLEHAATWLAEHESYRPDIIILVQATSPFTSVDEIDGAITLLDSRPDADAVTTVIEAPHNYHPYNIRQINEDGTVSFMMEKEHYLYPNRQLKPKVYAFGNTYVFRYQTLMEQKSIYGRKCLPLIIDPIHAFDVNDPHDMVIAEAIMNGGSLN